MSRLTKRNATLKASCKENSTYDCLLEDDCITCDCNNKILEKLAHYEDLEEAGRLIELPCAIGDDVYIVPSKVNFDLNVLSKHEENNRVYHQKVSCVVIENDNWYLQCDKDREYGTGRLCLDVSFGETWFLTKAEAERKLAELKGGGDDE